LAAAQDGGRHLHRNALTKSEVNYQLGGDAMSPASLFRQ
jgi:hypothetical protein